jgi:hypothetical protein
MLVSVLDMYIMPKATAEISISAKMATTNAMPFSLLFFRIVLGRRIHLPS